MTKVIAHRGLSARYPENTLLAFAKALEAGAEMMELDVRLTADKEIVVAHDLNLSRATDGHGPIDRYTLKELRSFNAAKLWPELFPEPIPTLREVIELVAGKAQLNIELKDVERHKDLPELVARELENWGDPDQFLFSSFDHQAIAQLRKTWPQYPCAILYGEKEDDPIAKARAVDAQGLHPHFKSISSEEIKKAQQAGLFVNVWTVNEPREMEAFLAWQVDGIITDHPDILWKVRLKKTEP